MFCSQYHTPERERERGRDGERQRGRERERERDCFRLSVIHCSVMLQEEYLEALNKQEIIQKELHQVKTQHQQVTNELNGLKTGAGKVTELYTEQDELLGRLGWMDGWIESVSQSVSLVTQRISNKQWAYSVPGPHEQQGGAGDLFYSGFA